MWTILWFCTITPLPHNSCNRIKLHTLSGTGPSQAHFGQKSYMNLSHAKPSLNPVSWNRPWFRLLLQGKTIMLNPWGPLNRRGEETNKWAKVQSRPCRDLFRECETNKNNSRTFWIFYWFYLGWWEDMTEGWGFSVRWLKVKERSEKVC